MSTLQSAELIAHINELFEGPMTFAQIVTAIYDGITLEYREDGAWSVLFVHPHSEHRGCAQAAELFASGCSFRVHVNKEPNAPL